MMETNFSHGYRKQAWTMMEKCRRQWIMIAVIAPHRRHLAFSLINDGHLSAATADGEHRLKVMGILVWLSPATEQLEAMQIWPHIQQGSLWRNVFESLRLFCQRNHGCTRLVMVVQWWLDLSGSLTLSKTMAEAAFKLEGFTVCNYELVDDGAPQYGLMAHRFCCHRLRKNCSHPTVEWNSERMSTHEMERYADTTVRLQFWRTTKGKSRWKILAFFDASQMEIFFLQAFAQATNLNMKIQFDSTPSNQTTQMLSIGEKAKEQKLYTHRQWSARDWDRVRGFPQLNGSKFVRSTYETWHRIQQRRHVQTCETNRNFQFWIPGFPYRMRAGAVPTGFLDLCWFVNTLLVPSNGS